MKYCEKCQKSFPDENIFCPECGEKLIDEHKCPRCGTNVSLDYKFCPKCGFDLKQGNKCQKCGSELPEGSKFCPTCGEKLNDNQIIEVEKKNKTVHKENKGNNSFILNCILIGVFFIVSILSIVGFFGDIFVAKALGEKVPTSISYFFGDEAEALKILKGTELYELELVAFILHSITYFGGFIALLVAIGFGIYSVVQFFGKKKAFPRSLFLINLLSVLPYVSLTAYMFVNKADEALQINLGWGTSMLVAVAIISACSFIASHILDGELKVKEVVARSLVSLSFLLIVLVSIFGVSKQILMRVLEFKAQLGIFPFFCAAALGEYSDVSASGMSIVVSMAFSVIMVFLSAATVFVLTKVKKSNIIAGIIYVSVILICSLVASLLTVIPLHKIYGGGFGITIGLGSGTVMTLVCCVISLGSLIATLVLSKEE